MSADPGISNCPIDSLVAAKAYFQAMEGSHFHMFREHPKRYAEYEAVGISDEVERDWRVELLASTFAKLRDPRTLREHLWVLHSRAERLVQTLGDAESVREIVEATECTVARLPPKDKLLVAETILGRQRTGGRLGLVYIAAKLGLRDEAKRLVELIDQLLTDASEAGADETGSF